MKRQQNTLLERVARLEATAARNLAEVMAAIASQCTGAAGGQDFTAQGSASSQGAATPAAGQRASGQQPASAQKSGPRVGHDGGEDDKDIVALSFLSG